MSSLIQSGEIYADIMSRLMMSLPAILVAMLWLLISALALTVGLYARRPALRMWCFPVLVYSAGKSLYAAKRDFGFLQSLAGLWADFILIYGLHALSILYIERRTLVASAANVSTTDSSLLKCWRIILFGYKSWFNARHVPTISPYQKMSATHESQAAFREKLVFIILNLSKLIVYYTIHFHILPTFVGETIIDFQPEDFSPTQRRLLRRLSEVTAREIVVRAYVASYWIWEGFFALDGMHGILSTLFVLTGLDKPEEWPPLYGYITQATGLKRFWSTFWHTIVVRPYRSYGELFTLRILRLNPKGHLAKTIVAFAIFAISGLVHAAAAWIFEQPGWEWSFWWFLLNFIGCTVETIGLAVARMLAARLGFANEFRMITNSWLGSLVGYTYVAAFFFWSVPKWRYPALYQGAVEVENMKRLILSLNIQ